MYGLLFLMAALLLVATLIVRVTKNTRSGSTVAAYQPVARHPLAHLYYAQAQIALDEAAASLRVKFTRAARERLTWDLASLEAGRTPPDGGEPAIASLARLNEEAIDVLKRAA